MVGAEDRTSDHQYQNWCATRLRYTCHGWTEDAKLNGGAPTVNEKVYFSLLSVSDAPEVQHFRAKISSLKLALVISQPPPVTHGMFFSRIELGNGSAVFYFESDRSQIHSCLVRFVQSGRSSVRDDNAIIEPTFLQF